MDGSDKYVGRILDNRYEILELIGAGGMANVYKARCHRLNRMVAVKILKEDLSGDEEFRRRFRTESQAVAMLSHPNIVSVYDVSHSGNIEYIVMELIEGISLKQYINRKGLLSWKEALHFATLISKALSHAHSRGIIHRDIKPHNIMILKDGSVKVADFGIARLLSVSNTLTQEALGSVHYISPEQAKGGHVDARSDIYSLGVVMYEMLTSRLPFVGDSPVSVAIQHISAIPLMPRDINPDIPIGLEDITMHAMEPDLSLRFTTADEMLNDLEDFRKNPSIIFNYAMSESHNRLSDEDDDQDDEATKIIPPVSVSGAASVNGSSRNHEARAQEGRPLEGRSPQGRSQEGRTQEGRSQEGRTQEGLTRQGRSQGVPPVSMSRAERADLSPAERAAISRIERAETPRADRPPPQQRRTAKKPAMTSDEYRTVRKRAASTSTLIGVFSIVVFIIVVLVFMWNYILRDIFMPVAPDVISIPTFVGRKFSDVIKNPDYEDIYNFVETYEISDEQPAGTILSQRPQPDHEQNAPEQGRKIEVRLVVAEAPPDQLPVPMPDLTGKHYSEAKNTIENLNLNLTVDLVPVINDDIPEGFVIETIPKPGVSLSRGNMVVIRYSTGPDRKPVTVPNLTGSTKAELESAFDTLKLIPDYRYFTNDEEAGTVTFIARIGEEVPEGTRIVVHISNGPAQPSETPAETDTETPPTDTPPTDTPPTDTSPSDTSTPETPTSPATETPVTDSPSPATEAPPTDTAPPEYPPTGATETPPVDDVPDEPAPGP